MSSLNISEKANSGLAVCYASRTRRALISSTALSVTLTIGAASFAGQAFAVDITVPVVVVPGQEYVLDSGDTVTLSGTSNQTAIKVQAGAKLTATAATISTNGTGATGSFSAGIRAEAGSTVDLKGGSVSGVGTQFNRGILAYDGSTVTTDDTDVSTDGISSHAVHVFDGATATINGGIVSTAGSDSFALYSQKAGSKLFATDVEVITEGFNGFGAFTYNGGSELQLNGGSITTSGVQGKAVVAGLNSYIEVTGTTIKTSGDRAWGLVADQDNTSIIATDVDITTTGLHAYGAHAKATGSETATITLTGGSITTANDTGRTEQNGDGARGYALFADGSGASIEADGTEITTLGQRSYGAYATNGAQIDLSDLDITTNGFMAYGVYASGADSVVTANDVNVTTHGMVGDAAWAYLGGTVNLNGGTYTVNGTPNPNAPGETANGLVAVGGTNGANDGTINASGVTVTTHGDASVGLLAGATIGTSGTSGTINLTDNSVITVTGVDADAARISYGSTLSVTGSSLVSEQGVGIVLQDKADVTLVGTSISANKETFVSELNSAGQHQSIHVGAGSVATENDGTLLRVNRSNDGANGVVVLTLGAGSTTSGNIVDTGGKTTNGGTDVTLETGATWSGLLYGVRNFFGLTGGAVDFDDVADISGNLTGTGTSYAFSDHGGTIGGNVLLTAGSSTTGGTTYTPIVVGGNVSVDATSILGGNWAITGNLTSSGTLAPGNSIGHLSVGSLNLLADNNYVVEVDGTSSDSISVTGVAALDGIVTVVPMTGSLSSTPYTILTAGSITGEFTGAEIQSEFLKASLAQSLTDVELRIERNDVTFASVAQSANQAAVGTAVDQLDLSNSLMSAVALSSIDDARVAFDQLSGEIHASTLTGLVEDSRHIREAASDRIRTAFGSVAAPSGDGAADESASKGAALWGSVFGSRSTTDGNGNTAEFDRTTSGIVVGLDGVVADSWLFGALAGYSRSSYDIDDLNSSADADNYHLGIYGGTQFGAIGLRTGMAYSWSSIESNRSVSFLPHSEKLSGDYNAGTFQIFGELGYKIDASSAALEPFVNLAHVRARTDSFTETGGDAALNADRLTANTTFTTLGLRASTELDAGASLHGMVGWRHAGGDVNTTVWSSFDDSDAFGVSGAPIAKNAAVVEAGVNFGLSQATSLDLSYSGQFASGANQHGLKSKLSVKF